MDPSVSAVTGINVNLSSPNSFSPAPGRTTTINTTMTYSTATTTHIPLSDTKQVINTKLINNNYLFWHVQMKSYMLGQ
jgi:hypothetical protein